MTSKRALLKVLISLVLIEANIHLADSTDSIRTNTRFLSQGDGRGQKPQHARLSNEKSSSVKRDFTPFANNHDGSKDEKLRTPTKTRPASSAPEISHVKGNSHRYSRNHQNRRNPHSDIRSAGSIKYSVLQPYTYGYHPNARKEYIRQRTPYSFHQNYDLNPTLREKEDQPVYIYLNLQATQNQNLPESQLKSPNEQVNNQYIQRPQQFVATKETSRSQDQTPLRIVTSQQGTVNYEAPSIHPTNLNNNAQRYMVAENQRQNPEMQSHIRAFQPNGNQNRHYSSIAQNPINLQDINKQQGYQYYKFIILPEDAENIEKPSNNPRQLPQTKSEETMKENSSQQSQTQQGMTSSPHLRLMEMGNQQAMAIQKMMSEQQNEMRKQEMEEPQRQQEVAMMAQTQRVKDSMEANTMEIPRQEVQTMEKQEENKASETVSQQIMDLLTQLTRGIAAQTERKVEQQKPPAILYQPLVVMQKQEYPEMRRQQPVDSQPAVQMDKENLLEMILQQITEIQKQAAGNLQAQEVTESIPADTIQTQNVMDQEAVEVKSEPTAEKMVPVDMEEMKQTLMKMIVEELTEKAKDVAAQPEIYTQKQVSEVKSREPEEKTEEQPTTDSKKSADMEMKIVQVMETLLQNIMDMRKEQLNVNQGEMRMKQKPMGIPLQMTMNVYGQDRLIMPPQSTIRHQAPMMLQSKASGDVPRQENGAQRQKSEEMPIRQTMERMNQPMTTMQGQYLPKMQYGDMRSPNAAVQTVPKEEIAMDMESAQPEITKQEQPAPKAPIIGYRRVLIHIPDRLTKQPRVFVPRSYQMTTAEAASPKNDTDTKPEEPDIVKNLFYSSMGNQETQLPQNLGSFNAELNSNIKEGPIQKFPTDSQDYYYLRLRPSYNPEAATGSSFHESSSDPVFAESPSYPEGALRSSLYSYDDMNLNEPSLFQNLPQIYKD